MKKNEMVFDVESSMWAYSCSMDVSPRVIDHFMDVECKVSYPLRSIVAKHIGGGEFKEVISDWEKYKGDLVKEITQTEGDLLTKLDAFEVRLEIDSLIKEEFGFSAEDYGWRIPDEYISKIPDLLRKNKERIVAEIWQVLDRNILFKGTTI